MKPEAWPSRRIRLATGPLLSTLYEMPQMGAVRAR